MKYLTDDVRITGMEEVIAPEALIAEQPMLNAASRTVYETRGAIGQILKGEDQRLLVVVGPCSIHDPDAAREYADRLPFHVVGDRDEVVDVLQGPTSRHDPGQDAVDPARALAAG